MARAWWAEFGAIVIALLAALGLAFTMQTARADLRAAAETLVRGEGEVLAAKLHEDDDGGPPTEQELAAQLARHAELRYVAHHIPGETIAAGKALLSRPDMQPGELIIRDGRAALAMPLPAPPELGERPVVVIEFEPSVLARLERGTRRTNLVGSLAALVLFAFAVVLTVRVARRARDERNAERERRLMALGQMSSVMAHELKNPLASLKGNAQLLAEMLQEGTREQVKAELVVSEAQRLELLTRDLLAFVRDEPIAKAPTPPSALVERATRGLSGIEVAMGELPPTLQVDAPRISAALGNLLRNAVQTGTKVTLSLAREGEHVVLAVRDHGPGIAAGEEEKIFEPFFTTRIHGTGLGLVVARRAVEQHGGTLTAKNHEGGGAVFTIRLPLA